MRLDHCCLNVRDLEEAIAWYQANFEMKLLHQTEIEENNATIAFVGYDPDGMKLELTHWRDWDEEQYQEGTMFDHIAVTVDDVVAKTEELAGNGVEVAMEPTELSTGSHISFVKDLDGNWVELVERP